MLKHSSFMTPGVASLFFAAGINPFSLGKCCVDSRLANAGDLFFALPGAKVDGHAYIEDAAHQGAVAAVVSSSYQGQSTLPLIRVEDPLFFLQALAKDALQWLKPRHVIGVTGSFGKTTTTAFLRAFLSSTFKTGGTQGNHNSQIGLPLTLLNDLVGDEEVVLLEMAMTEAGQISRLVEIAPPTRAVVTAVDYVHIGYFSGLEGVARAKGEIFSSPQTTLGWVSYDASCRDLLLTSGACAKKTFSVYNTAADVFCVDDGQNLLLQWEGKSILLGSKEMIYPLKHNLVAAAVVALEIGVPPETVSTIAQNLKPPEKRFQKIQVKGMTIISDSYNASGMRFALQNLPTGKRKIAALGFIPDLGSFSRKVHEDVGEAALHHVDILYCFGEESLPMVELWRRDGRPVEHFATRDALTEALAVLIEEGDVVLVKGALRSEMWKVVEALQR